MSEINQKEYLKKYLGIGKGSGERKKKKKSKKTLNGLKIVDDDVDIRLDQQIQEDLAADNEEAPQIVSIIDDRPPSLRIDEVTREHLWQPIGAPEVTSDSDKILKLEGNLKVSKNVNKHSSSNKIDIPAERSERRSRKSDISVRKNRDEVISPPKYNKVLEDWSPSRKSRHSDGDSSPPRRNKSGKSCDNSPVRSRNHDADSSPPRKIKREKSEDISPPRKIRSKSRDYSPPRRIKTERSPTRRHNDIDSSPPRNRTRSRWSDNNEEKSAKTLDGKKAGLQNASDLVQEMHSLKKKEDELFKNMKDEISGANAATIVRSKKKEVNWEEEEMRRKKEEENKEKYNKWGKGLKQVEDINEKIKNDLYEMSKPLARYADDKDLEKYLKDQEREGDPMLAYLRKKKKKKAVDEGKPLLPQFEGDAPPNRFGIRPGYRWDGVDRSNGYEKQWFQVQNSRKANVEETYKWSSEDM